jgi:hypothetical protein
MIDDASPKNPQQMTEPDAQGADIVASESRIPTYVIEPEEARALREATDLIGVAFEHASAADQFRIAQLVVAHLRLAAPRLCAVIASALADAPIQRIRGVPVGGPGDQLRATVLSLLRGEVFQFEEQLGGQLTAAIEPKAGAAPNSNASPDPFGFHTDDAIMPSCFRVEQIALLGIHNPPGTVTGFAILEDIL